MYVTKVNAKCECGNTIVLTGDAIVEYGTYNLDEYLPLELIDKIIGDRVKCNKCKVEFIVGKAKEIGKLELIKVKT